jgi:hypothetical protein
LAATIGNATPIKEFTSVTDQLLAAQAEKERPRLFTICGRYANLPVSAGADPTGRAGLRGFDIATAGVA